MSKAPGIPGTLYAERRLYCAVYCAGCTEIYEDVTGSVEYFKTVIRQKGWRLIGKQWCCPACVKGK